MAMVPQTMQPRAKLLTLSASDDNAVMKQVHATHAPVDGHIDVKPLLNIIQDIFHRIAMVIPPVVQGKQAHLDALDDTTLAPHMLDNLSPTISKISCQFLPDPKQGACLTQGNAHSTTMAILGMLSSYSWDSKVVIALAAFALNFGEVWLVTQLYATNSLAMSIAMLKHIPEILKQADILGLQHKYEAIGNLVKVMLDVTNCIVEFEELPSQYKTSNTSQVSSATTFIPIAVYWTIRSIVATASHISDFMSMNQHMASMTEAWELSSLVHKLNNTHNHLRTQLALIHRQIDDKKQTEAFQTLVRLFDISHRDNFEILKSLISCKDDQLPILDGSTKQRVNIDVLRSKIVMLYISDLDLSHHETLILGDIYEESRQELYMFKVPFIVVWIPVVNKTISWTEAKRKKLEDLQSRMPWYSIHDPSLIEQPVIKYIKEVWHFKKKPILVVLDEQGKVVNLNALHIMWIWGSLAYPFTISKEESIWREQTWGLDLLDIFHHSLPTWISEEKYICLYGGEDLEWIRKLTRSAHAMAQSLQVPLETIYMGKSNPGKKVEKNIQVIISEKLSHALEDLTLIWYFWVRVESMWHSKLQLRKTVKRDPIMQEVMTMLSFDGSNEGWAVMSRGTEKMVKAKGETFVRCLNEHQQWKDKRKEKGVLGAMDEYIQELRTPHQCNRLIVPESNGRSLEDVTCAECGRPMQKLFMYRCCND